MAHTRVTASDVQDLLDTNLTTAEIDPFLPAAKRFVDDNLEDTDIPDATLTEIEKHLAAGIVAGERDPTASSVSLGDASITYQRGGTVGEHFRVARMLDNTGTLASLLNQRQSANWRTATAVE